MTGRVPSVVGGSGGDGFFEGREGHAGVAAGPARELVDELGREPRFQIRESALAGR